MRNYLRTSGILMLLFRLLSAQPKTDGESWAIRGQLIQDQEWYQDAYGQDPDPFRRQPALSPRTGLAYPWQPAQLEWDNHDAMFPHPPSTGFDLTLDLSSYPATLAAAGYTPVNTPQSGQPPQVPLQATTANTGGNIAPGTYYIAVSSNGTLGPVSTLIKAIVPAGTITNTITVSGIVWPGGVAALPSAYAGPNALAMRYQDAPTSGEYLGSVPDANGNPTTFIFTNIIYFGIGLPDNLFQEYLIEASSIAIPGVFIDTVASVLGGNVLTLASGTVWTANQWQNRILSLYYRPGVNPQPTANTVVTSNTSSALTMAAGFGIPTFRVGDVVVMRVASSSITANAIGDAQLNLVASSQIGNQIRILSGTGANQPAKTIQSHTSGVGSVLTIQGTWDVVPDATSIWIITGPTDAYSESTNVIVNDGTSVLFGTVAQLALTWAPAQSLYVVVSTCDVNGNCYPQRYQPSREIYVPAQIVASGSSDGEYRIPIATVSRSLAAAIPNATVTAAALDASAGVPPAPFLITFGSECCLVTAASGAAITAMQRGYAGTEAIAHLIGSSAVVMTARPSVSDGIMQRLDSPGHITLLLPSDVTLPRAWTLDVVQDSTGGWAVLPSSGYTGIAPGSTGDPLKWDSSASMRYYVDFAIRSDGSVGVTGGRGPFSLT